ncbi:hypothetical protein PR048_011434 [Dryococelus australis]|uniref:PiggyBac transposable element-derived protein domain-containing protein n=1 Tax=Dryococelus australis TaxID=614101 RepID=A0ABQ9HLK5_9NEOP|nr:hypothetical protein PR048_011434 [Dryococelus australis]
MNESGASDKGLPKETFIDSSSERDSDISDSDPCYLPPSIEYEETDDSTSESETGYDKDCLALVERLMTDILDKGHVVYMDIFYSSLAVFDFLWGKTTLAFGTCMVNRKQMPKDDVKSKLMRDKVVFTDVLTLSTLHKATISQVDAKSKNRVLKQTKPDVILDYNIDKMGDDQVIS